MPELALNLFLVLDRSPDESHDVTQGAGSVYCFDASTLIHVEATGYTQG